LAMDRGLSVQEALADQPRWFAKPGFTACIPWEMDRNEGPEVDRLVICEGPGDGVRLYHEAYATDSLRPSFIKSHIVAVDSSASWTDASLAIPDNATGFFSGYSQIVLLMDKDSAGRRAAGVIAGLIRRQGSRAAIRNVDLSPYRDVSDFFDAGNGIVDIVSLINSTTTLRAQ
ncbi:MAG: toprim domain-containing protein, partial [Blastocatellia bacterium]